MIISVYNYKTRDEAIQQVMALSLEKTYKVTITANRVKRSTNQNSLYWLRLSCIEQETGQSKNDLHTFFKSKFLELRLKILFGEDMYSRPSTKELTTSEFTQYLDKMQAFAAMELGIKLPNPEDLHFEQFKEYYSKFI